jgi:ribonucleoside-diphosphate reductase alpha chain
MERIRDNKEWSLMCPNKCRGLADVYGDEFTKLYEEYEAKGYATKKIMARELWYKVLDAQMETGTPYLLFKDAVNKKSNQMNVGTIKSSNLCTEITLYSDDKETAVCNLASIALPTFVDPLTKKFDYEKLGEVTKVVTVNLNRVIDINFYPTEKTRTSNMRHRPIGIGVQGLADAFILMDIPFHSEQAKEVNKKIFETIYYYSLQRSMELAKDYGTYSTFEGSPASQGVLQYDMWLKNNTYNNAIQVGSEELCYEWDKLKEDIKQFGLRNSTLLAPMPTASTSQILGFNECFEPLTSNIYTRRTLAGEFVVVNKYLMRELIDMGVWNDKVKNNIIANKGSVQQLDFLSEHIRNKYKIVWEIPMKHVIDMSADRGVYICQSQSLNLWLEDPNYNTLTSMHFYSWKKGLKTGIYYLRRKAKHQAQQFTIEPEKRERSNTEDDICEYCSA